MKQSDDCVQRNNHAPEGKVETWKIYRQKGLTDLPEKKISLACRGWYTRVFYLRIGEAVCVCVCVCVSKIIEFRKFIPLNINYSHKISHMQKQLKFYWKSGKKTRLNMLKTDLAKAINFRLGLFQIDIKSRKSFWKEGTLCFDVLFY